MICLNSLCRTSSLSWGTKLSFQHFPDDELCAWNNNLNPPQHSLFPSSSALIRSNETSSQAPSYACPKLCPATDWLTRSRGWSVELLAWLKNILPRCWSNLYSNLGNGMRLDYLGLRTKRESCSSPSKASNGNPRSSFVVKEDNEIIRQRLQKQKKRPKLANVSFAFSPTNLLVKI